MLHASNASDADLANVFKSVSGNLDYENKLMYWGSVDGVMTTFPSVLWTRADDTCGKIKDWTRPEPDQGQMHGW